jgi:hypothetical protein
MDLTASEEDTAEPVQALQTSVIMASTDMQFASRI